MNQFYFLDLFLFIFLLQYLFYFNVGFLKVLGYYFFFFLKEMFSYLVYFPMSYFISFFTFFVLLFFCFFGYFSYSVCLCGMLEFTLMYSFIAWFSTFIFMFSSDKISVYFSKGGDTFLKTLTMLLVEVVSEFFRPLALTVRLTVNIFVGHLIIGFFYNLVDSFFGEFYDWLFVFAIMMECFVFFIQSYIFSRLIYLYVSE